MSWKTGILGMLVCAMGSNSGCPTSCDKTLKPSGNLVPVTVTLWNKSGAQAHMFVGDETFPCCELDPGGFRVGLLGVGENSISEQVKVGREGKIIATGNYTVSASVSYGVGPVPVTIKLVK